MFKDGLVSSFHVYQHNFLLLHSSDFAITVTIFSTASYRTPLYLVDTVPELQSNFIEQVIRPGSPISLHCSATGSPPPQFTWFLDGELLTAASVGHRYAIGQYLDQVGDVMSHVNISSTRVQDGGLYMCKATNSLGSVSHAARLNIYGELYIYIVSLNKNCLHCVFFIDPSLTVKFFSVT